MTLPRYVAATRPSSAQIVLEPDIELTAFVRRHLPLPTRSGIKVRGTDGRRGIADLRDGYADLVIIDAFVGARVPADLTTAEFLADARRALSDHGVIIINLTDRGPLGYARRVLAGVRLAFPHLLLCAEPSTLKGRRFGNVIIAGGATPLPYAGHRGASRTATFSVSGAAWRPVEPPACRLDAVQQRRCRRVSGAREGLKHFM